MQELVSPCVSQPSLAEIKRRATKVSPGILVHTPRQLNEQFWPIFTCMHLLVIVFMVTWTTYNNGFTALTFTPSYQTEAEEITLTGPQNITSRTPANPWLGQPAEHLIGLGGLFPPCMRQDYRIDYHYSRGVGDMLFTGEEKLGCCEMQSVNAAATVTKDRCVLDGAVWRPVRCSKRGLGENFVAHIIRPCCTGLDGSCHMTSPQHCWFVGGKFHLHAEHCYQVNCLEHLCYLGNPPTTPEYQDTPKLPPSYHQWWRFLTTVYIPQGVVDGVIILSLELPFSWTLERKLGWLRLLLVHMSAGAGGHLMGSLFSKFTSILTGGGPSLAGILAVHLVHHLEIWGLRPKLSKYTFCWTLSVLTLAFLGTIPHLSNHANVWGFVVGFLLAMIYIPFQWVKRICLLRIICLVILIFGFMCSLMFFYEVQPSEPCSLCMYIDCVPYISGICD
ncbi:inactive rhomboid protein 1 isoform X1 [Nematostella vectensis]|uniref:inactive rhomboid protein 1 isoform X1 n=1 Tax=Nematostella vectensis TaxID=45351 RepID=UPI0020779BA7|nr:inactive rhomboid protein 1 isoform X1 [Nematostella vectensis]